MRHSPALVTLLLLASCTSGPGEDAGLSMCLTVPSLRIAELREAAERYCAVEGCTGGDVEYCRFYLPFDVLSSAQLAPEPQSCLDALVAQVECDAEGACEGACEAERARVEARCEPSMTPEVPEPFDGATELCEAQALCFTDPSEPNWQFEVGECLASQGARLWVEDWLAESEPSCVCELQDLLSCLGAADLSCDPGRAEEAAACPEESGALSRCATGWSCVGIGGSGSPSSCEEDVSCGGTVYTVSCEDGACSCTVDGEPGPALTATDCDRAAFQECGAPD